MTYSKNVWKDQDVQRPRTYEVINNQDGSITLNDSFGVVTEIGTPVNAVNMNHIEDGIQNNDVAIGAINDKIPSSASSSNKMAVASDIAAINTALTLKADKTQLHALKGYLDNGTALTDAEGLADVTKYAHSTFDLSKFTVAGIPTITDDGIASGFSSSNYITFNPYLTSTNYKLSFSFEYDLSTQGYMIDGDIKLYSNGTLMQCIVVIGGVQKTITSTYRFDLNGSHKFDYELSCLNNLWTFKIKQGNSNWNIYTNTFDTGVFGTNCNFGRTAANKVDLKTVSIWNDGVPVFLGNKTGIDTIKPDDYTVVGSPTISADGVLTTSTNNYVLTHSFNITNAEDFELVSPFFNFETQSSVFQQGLNWSNTNSLHINDTWFYIQRRNSSGNLEVGIFSQNTNVYSRSVVTTDANTWYQVKFKYTYPNWFVYYRTKTTDWQQINSSAITDTSKVTIQGTRPIAYKIQTNESLQYGQADLNGMQVYVNGNLVYQPCLKIPYTQSADKYGSKIVDAAYRARVQDAWEQNYPQRYYTLDEVNGDFTLPQGEIYGMINRLQENSNSEIGLPIPALNDYLYDNEIWLEGAEVSKTTYHNLYHLYGDGWGTPLDSSNFVLPDFRNRAIWGADSYGYLSAGLPNITGYISNTYRGFIQDASGAFYKGNDGVRDWGGEGSVYDASIIGFEASRSNSIYGASNTVQPPAIKVRFKTRFE